MRISKRRKLRCDCCCHSYQSHRNDGIFLVECQVKGCTCQEYDEKEDYDEVEE